MKIYVASAFEDFQRTRRVQQALREKGHEITCDWTKAADLYPADCGVPDNIAAEHAIDDFYGVIEADCVVVLTNADRTKGCGMWIENGISIANGNFTVVAGPQSRRSIFNTAFAICVDTDQEAVEAVASLPGFTAPVTSPRAIQNAELMKTAYYATKVSQAARVLVLLKEHIEVESTIEDGPGVSPLLARRFEMALDTLRKAIAAEDEWSKRFLDRQPEPPRAA